ncbi:RDD family protein [Streptomyces sp. NPDC002537]
MTHPNPPGPYPSYPQQPGQPPYGQVPQQPGPPYPGQQPYPGQAYPGQQPYPGQPYPGQQYPGGGHGYGHPGHDPYAMQRPPYASWGARVGATLLDGLLGFIPAILFVIGLVMMIAAAHDSSCTSYDASRGLCTQSTGSAGPGLIVMFLGMVVGVALGFWMLYKQGKTGQTWGKKVVGISVLRERDGMPTGFGMAFVRNLCHMADGFFYLGYLWPLWDEKKQTFADKIVSTVVVRVK